MKSIRIECVLACLLMLASVVAQAQTTAPQAPTRTSASDWECQDQEGNRLSGHQRFDTALFACLSHPDGYQLVGGTYRLNRSVSPVEPEPEPPTCPSAPAAETREQTCPTGQIGEWTQTRSYAQAAYPTCWTPGQWTPSEAPAGACVTPPPPGGGDTIKHGQLVTVTGSGFGTKSPAAPVVWDTCKEEGLSSQWSGAWPSSSGEYNLRCRPPHRGVEPPHARSTMYLAGAHAQKNGASAGYNVVVWKTRRINSYPAYSYATWYQRADPQWNFCEDNNYKTFTFGAGTTPYDGKYWYHEYNPTFGSRAATNGVWHFNNLETPDRNGHSYWWGSAVNPHANWSKIEQEIRWATDGSGYVKVWENGRLVMNYAGRTDNDSGGGSRVEGIGGYARCDNRPNNWRYFADLYLDTSRSRIVLGNASTLDASRKRETQIPRSWSDGLIEYEANLGSFAAGETVYEFIVVDGVPVPSPRKLTTQ